MRPHRHLTKSELCTIIRGRFEVVVFDSDGAVTERTVVGEGTPNVAVELPHATWHTLLPLTDGAAFVEVKEGPYDPAIAAEFAAWAPEEGTPAMAAFQQWVERRRWVLARLSRLTPSRAPFPSRCLLARDIRRSRSRSILGRCARR